MNNDISNNSTVLDDFPMTRTCPFSPPPEFAELRERADWVKLDVLDNNWVWVCPTYDASREILSDPRWTIDRTLPGFPYMDLAQKELARSTPSMIASDEPMHSIIRRRATYAFTAKRNMARREPIQVLVDQLIDDMLAHGGPLDLVEHFTLVVPSVVIAKILGVPPEDHPKFHALTNAMFTLTNGPEGVAAGRIGLETYLRELILIKAKDLQDDMISKYIVDHLNTGELELPEVVSQIRTLLVAGHETTSNMIALSCAYLMENPEKRQKIVAGDAALVAGAVEELLRYLTILQRGTLRMALEDIVVDGHHIAKGEGVLVVFNSANRDPAAFERPDELDFEHPNRNHFAFGFGIHQCLGQGLS